MSKNLSGYRPLDAKAERALGVLGWFFVVGLVILFAGIGVWATAEPVLEFSVQLGVDPRTIYRPINVKRQASVPEAAEPFFAEIWMGKELQGDIWRRLDAEEIEQYAEPLAEDDARLLSLHWPWNAPNSVQAAGAERLPFTEVAGEPGRREYLLVIPDHNGGAPTRALRIWAFDANGAPLTIKFERTVGREIGRHRLSLRAYLSFLQP